MNITDKMANEFSEEIKQVILNNKEIQFYFFYDFENETDRFQFKDSRFQKTSSPWNNGNFATEWELIKAFETHIASVS